MDTMLRVRNLQRDGLLFRLNELAGGDTEARMDAAAVGHELGLPLERTLDIVRELAAEGAVHRCSKLAAGPLVHLTREGVRRARDFAA